VRDAAGWFGFAEVAASAARLNQIVTDAFVRAGLPVVSLPPSASALCEDGDLIDLDTAVLHTHLRNGLIPLVHGDVALDTVRGATIVSTEDVFLYLAREIEADRVLLAGEVAGVYAQADMRGEVIDCITPSNVDRFTAALGGSHGADVTGGMAAKVRRMIDWVQRQPRLRVRIFSASQPDALRQILSEPDLSIGTLICSAL
jgi:isopentenyl phosphate kinase